MTQRRKKPTKWSIGACVHDEKSRIWVIVVWDASAKIKHIGMRRQKLWPVISLTLSLALRLSRHRCTRTHTHTHINKYARASVCVCMFVCVYVCVRVCVFVCGVRPPLFARARLHFSAAYLLHDVFIQSTSPLGSRAPCTRHTRTRSPALPHFAYKRRHKWRRRRQQQPSVPRMCYANLPRTRTQTRRRRPMEESVARGECDYKKKIKSTRRAYNIYIYDFLPYINIVEESKRVFRRRCSNIAIYGFRRPSRQTTVQQPTNQHMCMCVRASIYYIYIISCRYVSSRKKKLYLIEQSAEEHFAEGNGRNKVVQ